MWKKGKGKKSPGGSSSSQSTLLSCGRGQAITGITVAVHDGGRNVTERENYALLPTLAVNDAYEGNKQSGESEQGIEDIKSDFLQLRKKYFQILYEEEEEEYSKILELEEKLSRLIFRLDDIDIGNNSKLKQARRETIKIIQDFLEKVQNKTKMPIENKNIAEIPEKIEALFKENFSQLTIMDTSTEAMDYQDLASDLHKFQDAVSELKNDTQVLGITHAEVETSAAVAVNGLTLVSKQRHNKPTIPNHEGPLQLLHLNKHTKLFELDEAAVKRVLLQPQVKNRKIAIVSIVGAFRRGKSFLLNFMLRYLNAQGSPNWLEQSARVEGFSWKGGRKRDTTGILMWPEPFLVGDNLAVVLLDTQGTFDNQTSMKENTFIFALSTLLSSVQIYNLHERIQMDDLSNLQYFLEFGRMVHDTSNCKVFGNLIFLIRDWKFVMENAYGFDGGKEVLDDWIQIGVDDENLTEANMIDVCFDQIKCFLMPHPGDAVSSNPNFSGKLSDIKPDFLQYLKHFIESIFTEGILSGKQIGGEFVNAEQFLMYMTTYVDKLQHPDIEPKTLYQSMCDTSHSQVVSQCKESYMREMQRAVREVTCDIQAAHQHAVDTALALYASTPKFGALCDNNLYKKKLLKVLEESYARFVHEFERQVESKLQETCNEAYDNYQATLNAFFMQLQPECSLEVKAKEACMQAIQSLKKLNHKISKEKVEQKVITLEKKMMTYYKKQAPMFKARQDHELEAQKKNCVNSVKQNVVQFYRTLMDSHCGGPDVVKEFNAINTKAEFEALALLQLQIKKYNILDSIDLEMEINKEIYMICENFRKHNERKVEKEKDDKRLLHMLNCHHQALEMYRYNMDGKCGGLKTVENIKELHDQIFLDAINLYTPLVEIYGEETCNILILKTQKEIEALYEQYYLTNMEKQQQNAKERAHGLLNIGLLHYKEQMQTLNIGTAVVENLPEMHDKIKVEAFDKLTPVSGTEYYKPYMKILAKEIKTQFDHYMQVNTAKDKQLRLDHMKEVQDKSIQFYVEKMDGLEIDKRPVENLEDKHTSFKTDALSLLDGLNEDKKSITTIVHTEIDKKWQFYKDQNEKMIEMFKNDELRTVKCAYNEMKAEYVTNMNKNMNACLNTKDATQLFNFHEQEKERILTNFREMTRECGKKNQEEYIDKLLKDIQTCFDGIEQSYGKNIRDLRMKEAKLKSQSTKNYAIGIDLGTTNCCAAVYKDGKVEIIKNGIDKTTTPSVVCFKENQIVFGDTAIVAGFGEPEHCVSEMKRVIGRRFDDPVVQSLIRAWPFKISNCNGKPVINVNHGRRHLSYKPEDVSSLLLEEMKKIAEVYLGSKVYDAVVTIPAYFNELQREATKAACVVAGLNVLRMINEPTAAAIAYGLQCRSEAERTILVFDFGGGTCDVSIMELEGTDFVVKASKGDNKLGGEDFDDRLTDHVTKIIERKYNVRIDPKARRRLRHSCERMKRKLSEQYEFRLQSEDFRTDHQTIDIDITIDKQVFENITKDLVQRALIPVKQCLNEAGLHGRQINEIVLVGGSSRMPRIQQMLRDFFEGKQMKIRINPDEAIAYGAAIQAAICTGEYRGYINIAEITPISLGVGNLVTGELSIIIHKNTKIPAKHRQSYFTASNFQDSMIFPVYQGECVEDEFQNTKIGEFRLTDIRKAKAGEVSSEVTFYIDADGILHVTAQENGNQRNKRTITITRNVT